LTEAVFAPYLTRWGLVPDGAPIVTHSSRLLPVRHRGRPAMLKVAMEAEERAAAQVMIWWAGEGAARVYAHEGDALVLERAMRPRSLAAMARTGADDEASRILCAAVARLHARTEAPPPGLVPLEQWFVPLLEAGTRDGGVIAAAESAARALLAAPQERVVLHGDLHHENVLDGGPRGWLAIDPKRLEGERGFDFANIFRDPDAAVATAPGRLARQLAVISEAAGLEPRRLLQWTLAFAGLSACWIIADGDEPRLDLDVATIAAAELAKG